MWHKSEDAKSTSESSAKSKVSPNLPAQPAAAAVAPSTERVTVNQGIIIKGEISGQGDLIVNGTLEGKVHLPDGSFTAGPSSHVTAEIEAREIIVMGEVVGTLRASERVHISSTGRLTGDMDTRGIVIEDGAVLHSKVATPRAATNQPEARKVPAPEAATEAPLAASAEVVQAAQPAPAPKESPRSKTATAGDS